MSNEQISSNLDKSIAFYIELSNLTYQIKRFNNSVFPGTFNYTGRIGINMNLKDIKNGKPILNDNLSAAEAFTYPEFKSDIDVLLALPTKLCFNIRGNIIKLPN